MQFAMVDGVKSEAIPKKRGNCPLCNSVVIAKCGSRVIHHWAHQQIRNCDPWWENETQWHRGWKNQFPIEFREVIHTDQFGEIHRADIKTSHGLTIEFQHSSLSEMERISRENFYPKLIWVLNGASFKDNFDIYHPLPDPKSELASDLVWRKAKRHLHGAIYGLFFRVSEAQEDNPEVTKKTLRGEWVHSIQDISDEVDRSYKGHHQYDWVRPRRQWLESKCPVFIDFGDEYLIKLMVYDESELLCIKKVHKLEFIYHVMTESESSRVGSG